MCHLPVGPFGRVRYWSLGSDLHLGVRMSSRKCGSRVVRVAVVMTLKGWIACGLDNLATSFFHVFLS